MIRMLSYVLINIIVLMNCVYVSEINVYVVGELKKI